MVASSTLLVRELIDVVVAKEIVAALVKRVNELFRVRHGCGVFCSVRLSVCTRGNALDAGKLTRRDAVVWWRGRVRRARLFAGKLEVSKTKTEIRLAWLELSIGGLPAQPPAQSSASGLMCRY